MGTIAAVHLSTIERRTPIAIIVVGTLTVTTNKGADEVKR